MDVGRGGGWCAVKDRRPAFAEAASRGQVGRVRHGVSGGKTERAIDGTYAFLSGRERGQAPGPRSGASKTPGLRPGTARTWSLAVLGSAMRRRLRTGRDYHALMGTRNECRKSWRKCLTNTDTNLRPKTGRSLLLCHGQAWPGHPRLSRVWLGNPWVAGPSEPDTIAMAGLFSALC